MNILVEKNHINELPCGSNFSYVLNENGSFLSTEYKVLQSQSDNCFVKCMKMLYNGKIQLYYVTKSLKPFSSFIPTLDVDGFLKIVSNIFADIIEVKHNGFLSCPKIDISFDRIYVDANTYKVSLVYIPVSENIHDDEASFENNVRTGLIKLISNAVNLSSPKISQFTSDLSNGTLKIEDLYNRIKTGNIMTPPTPPVDEPIHTNTQHRLRLIAMNAPTRVEIEVNKDEFVIGKKPELCDGIIGFNKMVSRSHCKICNKGSSYVVIDLQSANGTFVNGTRLQPNQAHPINNGDVIRMANSDFQVTII